MITISNAQEFALLKLGGEFDIADAADLEEAIGNLDSEPVIIVSLESVAFLDSSILSIIVRADSEHTGNLVVVLPDGARAERIFANTDRHDHFRFAPSLREAVAIARTLRDIAAASFSRDGAIKPGVDFEAAD